MGTVCGLRVGWHRAAALLLGLWGVSCEGETREYIPPNPAGAAGSGAAALPAMSTAPSYNAVGVREGDPPADELMTDVNRLQPANEPGSSGAAGPANPACPEGVTESCGPPREEGICKFGIRSCTGGQWGECMGAVFAQARDCSSTADNDCDGQPDDTQDDVCRCPVAGSQACDEHVGLDGKGACKAGKQICVLAAGNASSNWGPCDGSVGPANADSCNVTGDDSNCDGTPNGGCACVEGTTIPCGPETDNGVCQRGTSTCRNGAFSACEGAVFPARRDCSSAQDNDCDSLPDNTVDGVCTCAIGTTQACGAHPDRDGNGPCRAGTQTCEGSGQNSTSRFSACNGAVGPAQRDLCTAAGDDSDCNGTRNGGCQCIAGGGNAPCSGDANNSRCTAQGTCAPCQVNADCSLVSAGRSVCNAGACVAPAPASTVPVVTVQRFAWTSRQAPVVMGSTQGRACFLTRVGGAFNSAQDTVEIVAQNGQWVLRGTAAAGGFVEGRAGCVGAQVTDEVTLQAGQTGIDLQSFSTHACFLTRISGPFQGGAENVQLARSGTVWRFTGTSQQQGTAASARCMPIQPLSATFVMDFGDASPVRLDPEINGACFLLRVAGDLGAEGDFLETEWNANIWELRRQVGGGRSLQSRAACFGRNDGSGVPLL